MGNDPASTSRVEQHGMVGSSGGRLESAVSDPVISMGSCDVYASFEITPKEGCVLASMDEDAEVIQHYFASDSCEVLLDRGGDSTEIVRGETIDTAVCPLLVMSDYDGSSIVREVTGEGYIVDAYITDDDELWTLVDDLREITEELTVRRIADIDETDVSPVPASVDLEVLTDKQHEALNAALEEGYYERPRHVSQAELAEQFGISKQAMSRRLARAERAIFEQLSLG